MVIHEKALVNSMKDAYKGGGYTVICRDSERTAILCPDWAVELDNGNLPREVLSLLALHMGYLPGAGEAVKVMKADKEPTVQRMIFETAMLMLTKMELPLKAEDYKTVPVKKTLLTLDGCNVWQKTGNQGIILIAPKNESILRKRDSAFMAGNGLFQKGEASWAWIFREEETRYENQLNHLGKILWVAK